MNSIDSTRHGIFNMLYKFYKKGAFTRVGPIATTSLLAPFWPFWVFQNSTLKYPTLVLICLSMYKRKLEDHILAFIKSYRCITLVGPRQTGKTTICKKLFKGYEYFSFENPDTRLFFESDPRGFLAGIEKSAVFDEVQKVPDLLSYLQEILDDKKDKRSFILTGSNNLKLSSKVSQTLAGRTKILEVLPLERSEIKLKDRKKNIEDTLFFGSYPRIYDEKLNPYHWCSDYFQTYVEKDIRETIQITNLKSFNNFIRLLAGRVGQLVNYNSLASDAGVSQPTAKAWVNALETTYICFTLAPHFKNFSKRLIKASKVYFYDTGLLCYLLRIQNTTQLKSHPLKGLIFENWVIAEMMKKFKNQALDAPLYFWRDHHGHEVDLVIDNGIDLDLFEIKVSQTFHSDFVKSIKWLNELQEKEEACCIYGGKKNMSLGKVQIKSWQNL
jgi:predicted AAA+ superfamily ATPase